MEWDYDFKANLSNTINSKNIIDKRSNTKIDTASTFFIAFFVGATLLSPSNFNYSVNKGVPDCPYVQPFKSDFSGVVAPYSIDLLQRENMSKIEKMATFQNDWNGNGGSVFSKEAILLFKKLISSLLLQPQIAPTGRNSLLLQYIKNDKSMLAFEVTEQYAEMVLIPKGNFKNAISKGISTDIINNITKNVECFYGNGSH